LLSNRNHAPIRASLRQQLWWRGDPLLWTHTASSRARMAVLSSVQHAEALLSVQPPWLKENPDYDPRAEICGKEGEQGQHWSDAMLQPSAHPGRRSNAVSKRHECSRMMLLPGCSVALAPDLSDSDGGVAAEESIIAALGMSPRDAAVLYSPAIHRMLNGWDAPGGRNDGRQVADVLTHLGTVLRASRPSSLLVFNDGSPVAVAAALAARMEGVPVRVEGGAGQGNGLYAKIADAVASA